MKTDRELALEKHKYVYTPGGVPGVNVTAISGLLDDGKADGMAGAAAKITREGGNHRELWKAARDLGTRVHDHCEYVLRREEFDCLVSDEGYIDALDKFMVDLDPRVIESEEIALSHLGYGGRFDMIVEINGETWLLDLKTGKHYAVDHTLQLAAYRFADGIAEYDEAGMLTGLRPMPQIDHAGCLYVREDGTYSLVEYPADENAFLIFSSLLAVYAWTRADEMKAVIKESKVKK